MRLRVLSPRCLRACGTGLLLAALAPCQGAWVSKKSVGYREDPVVAYDEARERVVLFGGRASATVATTTWEWDGQRWSERTPAQSPPARVRAAMTYDRTRRRCVLFGGKDLAGNPLADTWEWDGVTWRSLTPAGSPSPRRDHALAFDAARLRVLLFGGRDAAGNPLSDTWEWNGGTWIQLSPVTTPFARSGHALAYDDARNRVVLFSGSDGTNLLPDTWEWNGTDWAIRTPAMSPPARTQHVMVYDHARSRVLLFGGRDSGGRRSDSWEWDGTDWSLRAGSPSPPEVTWPAAAFDVARGGLVLFARFETWALTGTTWARADSAPHTDDPNRMVYDSARQLVVMFGGAMNGPQGGLDDGTWEWDGFEWTLRTPSVSPPTRDFTAMAYDAARRRVVLFGGNAPSPLSRRNDTWEWDGINWVQRSPATLPLGRTHPVMAYDAARQRVVMFGGVGCAPRCAALSDTWEWNGSDWTRRAPATIPTTRWAHAMAYDSRRQVVVMFGGRDRWGGGATVLGDTWQWNGTTWTQLFPPASPGPSFHHAMTYDPTRQRVVLHGGSDSQGLAKSDWWSWDGTNWTLIAAQAGSGFQREHGLVYDAARSRLVLHGAPSPLLAETWIFGATTPAATQTYGAGCAGSNGTPLLDGFGRPSLGNPSFAFDLSSARASAPAALLFSLGQASTPLGGGCTLLVDPATTVLGFGATASSSGFVSVPLSVPATQALIGGTMFVQAVVLDPAGPFSGLASSNGLRFTVGE